MFKNCIAYKVTPGFRFDAEMLRRRQFRECGATDSRTDGFTDPCTHSTAGLVHSTGGYQLICWQTEDKLLPGSVVAEALAEKAYAFEKERGFKPGKKILSELRENVVLELLPRAFTQKRRTFAVLGGGYLLLDTSSPARADDLIGSIRRALDAVPCKLISTKISATGAMATWIRSGEPPAKLTIDSEAVLEMPTEEKPVVHYLRTDLGESEVVRRVEAGYMPKKVGMTFDDKVSFVLNHHLHISRIAQLDLLEQAQRHEQAADMAEEFDGDVEIAAGLLVRLLDYLIVELGGIYDGEVDLLAGAKEAAQRLDDMARRDGATATISDASGNVLGTFGAKEGSSA